MHLWDVLTHYHTTNFRLFQTEEITVGKGEIAYNEQFLLFPQCFQKDCFPGLSKGVIVWERAMPFFLSQHGSYERGTIAYLPNNKILDLSRFEIYVYASDLTFSQTSPGFYVSAVEVFWKHSGKRRNFS